MLHIPYAMTDPQNPTATPDLVEKRRALDRTSLPPAGHPAGPSSVVVEDLICVLQDRIDHLALEARVSNIAMGAAPHERGAEHDGQILARHPVCSGVLYHAVEVQCNSTKRCVVRVW